MRNYYKLDIDRLAFSDKRPVKGRYAEINKLVNILLNDRGSITLIAGDRGSGKTSLIEESLIRLRTIKYSASNMQLLPNIWYSLQKYMRNKVMVIEIPLLPRSVKGEVTRQYVLSWIAQAIFVEYRNRSVFDRLKMPLFYGHALKSLQMPLMLKSMHKTNKASIKLPSVKSFDISGTRETSLEYNLDYADLELSLKSFLVKYSKHLTFIIVFDELDKYELASSEIDPKSDLRAHDYIQELKNLFTASRSKFIFTSTENYSHQISYSDGMSSASQASYRASLFTHTILLNQLHPSHFQSVCNSFFVKKPREFNEEQMIVYENLIYSLMWLSDLMPFSLKRIVFNLAKNEENGDFYIDLDSVLNELDTEEDDIAIFAYITSEVYELYATDSDSYLNRFLYKALKKTIQIIFNGTPEPVNKSNLLALIFADLKFESSVSRQVYFTKEFHYTDTVELAESADYWELEIMNLGRINKTIIADAVTNMVYTLDALGLITSEQSQNSISMATFYPNSIKLDLSEIKEKLDTIKSKADYLNRKRDRLIVELNNLIKYTGYPGTLPTILTIEHDNKTASGVEYLLSWSLQSQVQKEIRVLNRVLRNARHYSKNNLQDHLKTEYSSYTTEDDRGIIIQKGQKSILVTISPSASKIRSYLSGKQFTKIVVVNSETAEINNRSRLKYFTFDQKTFRNYLPVRRDMQKYISKYIDQS